MTPFKWIGSVVLTGTLFLSPAGWGKDVTLKNPPTGEPVTAICYQSNP